MNSRILALSVALCLLGAMLSAATPAAGKSQKQRSAGSLLFVQQTRGGELDRVGPGVYRLTFRGVSPTVSTFTDRPRRRAGEQGLARFVRNWADNGFAADPPNAALVLRDAPNSRDVAMLTLSHPRYDRRKGVLAYTAKPLHGDAATSLRGFSRRGDRLRPLSFGAASLFVDDAGSATTIVPIQLQVAAVQPFQQTVLEITTPEVFWSVGGSRTQARGLGFSVSTTPGLAGFADLSLNPTTLSFRTSSDPGPGGATIDLFVESPAGTGAVTMDANVGQGVTIVANLAGEPFEIDTGIASLPLEPF